MNKNKGSLIFGIIILLLGVIFLGNSLSLWNIDIFFDGWWTLLIIIPSFIGMIKDKTYAPSFLVISVGILMLCACQDIIKWNMVGKLFIPLLLITVGLTVIFKPFHKKVKYSKNNNSKDDYIGVFSGTTEKVTGTCEDADIVAVFGSVELDLRNAKIENDITLECVTVFGGIDIKVPNNVIVKTSGVPIFGGMDNKYESEDSNKKVTIYVNYVSIFGGVDIK